MAPIPFPSNLSKPTGVGNNWSEKDIINRAPQESPLSADYWSSSNIVNISLQRGTPSAVPYASPKAPTSGVYHRNSMAVRPTPKFEASKNSGIIPLFDQGYLVHRRKPRAANTSRGSAQPSTTPYARIDNTMFPAQTKSHGRQPLTTSITVASKANDSAKETPIHTPSEPVRTRSAPSKATKQAKSTTEGETSKEGQTSNKGATSNEVEMLKIAIASYKVTMIGVAFTFATMLLGSIGTFFFLKDRYRPKMGQSNDVEAAVSLAIIMFAVGAHASRVGNSKPAGESSSVSGTPGLAPSSVDPQPHATSSTASGPLPPKLSAPIAPDVQTVLPPAGPQTPAKPSPLPTSHPATLSAPTAPEIQADSSSSTSQSPATPLTVPASSPTSLLAPNTSDIHIDSDDASDLTSEPESVFSHTPSDGATSMTALSDHALSAEHSMISEDAGDPVPNHFEMQLMNRPDGTTWQQKAKSWSPPGPGSVEGRE